MAGDKAPRSESRFRGALGFLYTQALTDNANTNQSGIRAIRATGEGFQVAGHASQTPFEIDELIDAVPADMTIDVAEYLRKLLSVFNGQDQDLLVEVYGMSDSGGTIAVLLNDTGGGVGVTVVPSDDYVFTLTDPWPFLYVYIEDPLGGGTGTTQAQMVLQT